MPQSAAQRLADLAPTLKEAELRSLVYLTPRAEANPHHTVAVSSRQLATATRLARDAVQRALDTLSARGLITTRQGTATRPAVHLLNFLDTVRMGGCFAQPPNAENTGQPPPRRYR